MNKLRRTALSLEQLHATVTFGGGYEAKSRVTFSRKDWAPLPAKPRFPDLSTFESGSVLLCLIYYRILVVPDCSMAMISFKS